LTTPVSFVVAESESGERLDRLLVTHVAGLGRKRARELFAEGRVTVDGRIAKNGGKPAKPGDEVAVTLDPPGAAPDAAQALDVRFEGPEVAVVEKPAGQPTAPIRPGELGTLANAIAARFPKTLGVGHQPREPGLLHRLDTQTSGLVIVALSARAFATLNRALGTDRLTKRYLAIVEGALDAEGSIDWPLGPDPGRKGRVAAYPTPPRGYFREAATHFRVVEERGSRKLVELSVARAFRHQVRAHLAALGAPLVGDTLYGGSPWPGGGERHALHASYVAWAGDATVANFRVESALPDDMRLLFGG
jgi:23S rRNA pseudouridine1911/1915/1917 synthase